MLTGIGNRNRNGIFACIALNAFLLSLARIGFTAHPSPLGHASKFVDVPTDIKRVARKMLMQGKTLFPEERVGKVARGGTFHPEENLVTVTSRNLDTVATSAGGVGRVDFYVMFSRFLAIMLGLRDRGTVKNAAVPVNDIFESLEPHFVGTLTDRSIQYLKTTAVDPQKVFSLHGKSDTKYVQISLPSPYDPESNALSMTFPVGEPKVGLVRTTTENDFWKKVIAELDVRNLGEPVRAEVHTPNRPVVVEIYSPISALAAWNQGQEQTSALTKFLLEVIERVTGIRPPGIM